MFYPGFRQPLEQQTKVKKLETGKQKEYDGKGNKEKNVRNMHNLSQSFELQEKINEEQDGNIAEEKDGNINDENNQ